MSAWSCNYKNSVYNIYLYAHAHIYAHMYTCIRTHICTHVYMHTHKHTHTHTCTAGEDFEAINTTLSFGSDFEDTQIVTITILDDDQIESSEIISLQLWISKEVSSGSIQLIPDVAQVIIQDNDSELIHSNNCSSAGLFMQKYLLFKCSYTQGVLIITE